jgi:hypothetical protein
MLGGFPAPACNSKIIAKLLLFHASAGMCPTASLVMGSVIPPASAGGLWGGDTPTPAVHPPEAPRGSEWDDARHHHPGVCLPKFGGWHLFFLTA